MIAYLAGELNGLPVQVQIPDEHFFATHLPAWQAAYQVFINEFQAQNLQLEVNDWWRAKGNAGVEDPALPVEWWIRISRAPQGYIVYPE